MLKIVLKSKNAEAVKLLHQVIDRSVYIGTNTDNSVSFKDKFNCDTGKYDYFVELLIGKDRVEDSDITIEADISNIGMLVSYNLDEFVKLLKPSETKDDEDKKETKE